MKYDIYFMNYFRYKTIAGFEIIDFNFGIEKWGCSLSITILGLGFGLNIINKNYLRKLKNGKN